MQDPTLALTLSTVVTMALRMTFKKFHFVRTSALACAGPCPSAVLA